ncbi:hypothetical protein ESA94_04945 [Lacibacter luteus]|uniref:E3 ubiquitin-protein ligase NRDP1 domain-containing protein n=1 Tax=Lacibacter luteus TaxID=2508719 RepID=A0A4Q1CNS1_9BACT|nr:hypothetical protein [Lacibacter luteus]RXK62361.1 hypothetical protein ESA94_04945 [Lacibacter luteus]
MKLVSQIMGIFLLVVTAAACTKGFYIDGKKAVQVKVTDLGEMYSTYNITESEQTEVKRQLTDKGLMSEIIRYSKENQWPDAVNTLDERLENRSVMMKYNFYKVASFGNKTIVAVPQEKNKHMPAAYIPQGPMYIIFASKVIASK